MYAMNPYEVNEPHTFFGFISPLRDTKTCWLGNFSPGHSDDARRGAKRRSDDLLIFIATDYRWAREALCYSWCSDWWGFQRCHHR